MMVFLLAVGVLTGLAIGAGGMFGLQVSSKLEKKVVAAKAEPTGAQSVKGRFTEGANLRTLGPIVTNLASPDRTWIRLEASILTDGDLGPDGNALTASITEDMIAFLRTVSLAQIEGASGYQHLREDLNDRIRIRGGSKVRDLIIHTLIVE